MEDAPLREPRFQLLDGRQVLEAHLVKGPHPFALRLQRAHLWLGRTWLALTLTLSLTPILTLTLTLIRRAMRAPSRKPRAARR